MTSRGTKWTLHTGFAVLSIPENGLFYRKGQLETGDGVPVAVSEMILFARRADAEKHAQQQAWDWQAGDRRGNEWKFTVISVLVNERM